MQVYYLYLSIDKSGIDKWSEYFFNKQIMKHHKNIHIPMFFAIVALSCHDLFVFAGLYILYKKRNSQVSIELFCLQWCQNSAKSFYLRVIAGATQLTQLNFVLFCTILHCNSKLQCQETCPTVGQATIEIAWDFKSCCWRTLPELYCTHFFIFHFCISFFNLVSA